MEEVPDLISSRVKKLYESKEFTDVSFVVGNETIKAHRLVLAMVSPVLRQMMFGELREENDIHIIDADPETFHDFLASIYTDEVILKPGTILEMINLAMKYQMKTLLDRCRRYLLETVSLGSLNMIQPNF